jgi:hypothetical protein
MILSLEQADMSKKIILIMLAVTANAYAFPWYTNGGYRGAELMSPLEQQTHAARLQSMKTLNECRTYMNAHEAELQKRAAAAKTTLAPVKGDPCAVMLQMGRIRG